jgi:hypothetical protein
MTSLRHAFIPLGIGVGCFVAGYLALVLIMGTGMFSSTLGFSVVALIVALAGASLCGYVAFRNPRLWILWPLLFGSPIFTFGMLTSFSPPDPRGVLLWRTLAVAFLALPLIAAFYGRTRWRRLIE